MSTDRELLSIKAKIDEITKRREELFELRKPIEKELRSVYKELETLKSNADKLSIKAGVGWGELLDGYESTVLKKELESRLRPHNISIFGYHTKTLQCSIAIGVPKKVSDSYIQEVVDGVNKLLPHMRSFKDEVDDEDAEVVPFELNESTNALHGLYTVYYDINSKKWSVNRTVYNSLSTLKTCDTLADLLQYVSVKHPRTTY